METAIRPLQVSEVNAYIKELLDRDENLRMICIEGEISNYVNHTSGHSYFTLKDKSAALKAVFFKGYKTVSYTHLDVYKRQAMSGAAGPSI